MLSRHLRRDRGFSFIELLAYMAIAALLVLAAVPQFGQYRQKATVSNMQNDVRNASLNAEAARIDLARHEIARGGGVQLASVRTAAATAGFNSIADAIAATRTTKTTTQLAAWDGGGGVYTITARDTTVAPLVVFANAPVTGPQGVPLSTGINIIADGEVVGGDNDGDNPDAGPTTEPSESATTPTAAPTTEPSVEPTPTTEPSVEPAPDLRPKFVVTFAATCKSVYLPVDGTIDAQVDWGDGVVEPLKRNPYHTFKTTREDGQQVTVRGTFEKLIKSSSYSCYQSIDEWGETGTTDISSAFAHVSKLTKVSPTIPSTITNMTDLFTYAKIGALDLSSWDVSNVTNMSGIFEGSDFNGNVTGWNTSKVTTFDSAFYGARSFNQPLKSWDTRSATNMAGMFNGAAVFDQDLSTWDTSRVTTMSYMFYSADAFNGKISTWNTGNVTNMTRTFSLTKAFNQPIGSWNVSKVQTFTDMFSNAWAFNQSLANWKPTSATNMDYMFTLAKTFSQNLSGWPVPATVSHKYFESQSPLTAAQLPKFKS